MDVTVMDVTVNGRKVMDVTVNGRKVMDVTVNASCKVFWGVSCASYR